MILQYTIRARKVYDITLIQKEGASLDKIPLPSNN